MICRTQFWFRGRFAFACMGAVGWDTERLARILGAGGSYIGASWAFFISAARRQGGVYMGRALHRRRVRRNAVERDQGLGRWITTSTVYKGLPSINPPGSIPIPESEESAFLVLRGFFWRAAVVPRGGFCRL